MITTELLQLYDNQFIQSKRGDWWIGDMYCSRSRTGDLYGGIYFIKEPLEEPRYNDCIWIPRTYDERNINRSLWGMVNWHNIEMTINYEGRVTIHDWNLRETDILCQSYSLDECLLRTINIQQKLL
jgi:hypothetical protein